MSQRKNFFRRFLVFLEGILFWCVIGRSTTAASWPWKSLCWGCGWSGLHLEGILSNVYGRPFITRIKNNCFQSHYTTRTEPRVVRSTKLSGIRTWMGDQKRIPCVVITSFFFIPFRRRYLRLHWELPSLVWFRFFYFSTICSSFRHVRIRVYIYNIVQSYK